MTNALVAQYAALHDALKSAVSTDSWIEGNEDAWISEALADLEADGYYEIPAMHSATGNPVVIAANDVLDLDDEPRVGSPRFDLRDQAVAALITARLQATPALDTHPHLDVHAIGDDVLDYRFGYWFLDPEIDDIAFWAAVDAQVAGG